jgi:uncharacterized membrane protein
MLTVTLYVKNDCSLCDQAKADLQSVQGEVPHRLVEINIGEQPDSWREYRENVPVVEVGPYRKSAPFTRQELLVTLRAARDRQQSLERVADPSYLDRVKRGQEVTGGDRFSFWLSRHYLLLLNFLVLLYVGLPFLAPVLMKAGATSSANVIYTAYSPLCHELSFRSFFLFGPQFYYPRAAAGVAGVETFGQATGINENDLWTARSFRGNEQVGYKVSLCERDVAIYGAILLFGLLFALGRDRIPKLHWMLWFLIGIAPIGFDGFSQLISQMNLPALAAILPYRESTPFLRVLTGALFGFTTAWFGYPYIEESMHETQQVLMRKFAVIAQHG